VKVEAIDARGNRSWSNELAVLTAAAAPVETSTSRLVLDDHNALDQVVTADRVSYRLPAGASPPNVGDIIVSTVGEGYLRRVTSVSVNADQVSLQTVSTDLSETFQEVQLSNQVKLIDLPEQPTLAGAAAMRTLSTSRADDLQTVHWPERGLTLTQRVLPTTIRPQAAAAAATTGASCDGSGGRTKTKTVGPLQVTFPEIACVEPGVALSIAITALIQSGKESEYEITQLVFEKLEHPKIKEYRPVYGAVWMPPNHGSDTRGTGTLSWLPDDRHIDDQGRPFTAHFYAKAKKRGNCGIFGTDLGCDYKNIDFDIPIYVSWGEVAEKVAKSFASASAQLSISGEAQVDFQPAVTADADLQGATLHSAVVRLDGPLSFRTEARLQANANGTYQFSQPMLDKRFVKVLWAGNVPIVINGQLVLTAQFRAQADGALDINQVLELGYDLTAGLEYRDGNWTVLREATPWQRYELRGDANTRAFVEVRFVPDLTVKFYDVAGGRLLVEPYLYAEAALEGRFVYRDDTGEVGSDADYRFKKLEYGGGIDGAFRLGLEIFNMNLAGYPSRDPNELYRFELIGRTSFAGLPALSPSTEGALRIDGRCAIGLKGTATPVPNPFQWLGVGADTWNPFVEESADWEVIMPSGEVQLTYGSPRGNAWFSASQAGRYTLRFSGYSKWGSFIRQYEDMQVDYDPAALDCPGAGMPWVTPASGAWLRSPRQLSVVSDGADILYYSMATTTDGSAPTDPPEPTPSLNNGWLVGSTAPFELHGNPGQLKRAKLRFIGCNGSACGPASPVLEYSIDLRGGGGVEVSPASGSWLNSPQTLTLRSGGANSIYYSISSTNDGSTPADPSAPSSTSFDGVLGGPETSLALYGRSGQLRRIKLRFVGCSANSCGPVTAVFEYSIDLRGGGGVQPASFPLNDTGITQCGNASQNNLPCPVSGFPGQDAQSGRDVTHNVPSDGHAGFSFTKISNSGQALPASAALGSGPNDWACTRDNVTGLIWEVKTNSGLRHQNWTYSWYNPDASTNGGSAGYADYGNHCYDTTRCDTHKYVADVNLQGLCGASDWRLASVDELLSIVSNDRINPAIDTAFFPNTPSSWFWSSSPGAGLSGNAWYVFFYYGYVYYGYKGYQGYVRLVRGGQ
jgi:hypothetical protein